jgi:hypothetical protein
VTPDEAELLATVGRELWRATLTGNAPPAIVKLRQRMQRPVPGDLVIEITSWSPDFDPDSIGRLISLAGDPDMPDRVVIEPLCRPGVQQGWQNARFVALPDRRKWVPE